MKKVISLLCVLVLTVGCLFVFASCGAPNSDPQAAKAALESAGYYVSYYEYETYTYIHGTLGEEYVYIYYYDSEALAEADYAAKEAAYEEEEALADVLGIELDYEVGISGTMVYKGTSKAISAAK